MMHPGGTRRNSGAQKHVSFGVRLNTRILASTTSEAVFDIVTENDNQLNNVNITTAIHRLAKICHRKPHKIKKAQPHMGPLVALLQRRCVTFTGRQLANTAWGLAIMQYDDHVFFLKIADQSLDRLEEFEPQHLAILVWSFATMDIRHEELFNEVANRSMARLHEFSPQNLSNLSWSFAQMNMYHPTLFKEIAEHACASLTSFAPQNISNMVWSFAGLRVPNVVLFQKVVHEAVKRLESFNTQNLSNLSWSFAMQTPTNPLNTKLFDALAAISLEKMEYFNERYLSNLVWAFVVVDKFPRDLFAEVFHKINEIDAQQLERMSDTDQSQWYQADLALRLQVPELAKMFGLARPLRKKFGRVFLLQEMEDLKPEKEIAMLLDQFRIPFKTALKTKSGYCLAFVLLPTERKIAIEFEGLEKFLHQTEMPTGPTVLKRRLMVLMGWSICSIPWWEWNQQVTLQDKQGYMTQKLIQCGMQLSEILNLNGGASGQLTRHASPPATIGVASRSCPNSMQNGGARESVSRGSGMMTTPLGATRTARTHPGAAGARKLSQDLTYAHAQSLFSAPSSFFSEQPPHHHGSDSPAMGTRGRGASSPMMMAGGSYYGHHTPPLRPNLSHSSSTRTSPDITGNGGSYALPPRGSPASSGGSSSRSSFDAYVDGIGSMAHPVDQLHAPPSAPLAPPPFALPLAPAAGNTTDDKSQQPGSAKQPRQVSPYEGATSPHVGSVGRNVHQPGGGGNSGVPLKQPKAGTHLQPGDMERKLLADDLKGDMPGSHYHSDFEVDSPPLGGVLASGPDVLVDHFSKLLTPREACASPEGYQSKFDVQPPLQNDERKGDDTKGASGVPPTWLPNPIIDGLLYKTQSIEGLVFWLSDVIMTKELSPVIGRNSRFGTVEIDLSKFVANYRAAGRTSKIVYSHPIQLNRTE